MPLKYNWANGEQFQASDANDVAIAVNAAYTKPGTGIPATDLASAVQTSLGKADSAVQSVSSTSITDATTTGKAVLVATDAAAARTALGVAYGTSSGTVAQGNDSRFTPASTSISDSTATGRALLTTTDASTARTTLGVAYGTSSGTVAQGNDSRITGAQQTSEKGNANGYASLDSGGKVPIGQLPSSIMEYQGVWNASTNTPTLADGTGSPGDVYRVTVAGSRNLGSGSISFSVGDYCVMNSSNVWEKSDTTDAVSTVAGRTGDVTLAAADVSGVVASGGALGTPSSGTVSNCVGQVADVSIVAFGANTARAASSYGDFSFGIKLQRAITFTSVTFRAATADASGNLVVELRKNGTQVSGTSTTIAAASQVAGGTSTGTWAFASGDILTVYVTGVGTTPGKGLIADIKGLTT